MDPKTKSYLEMVFLRGLAEEIKRMNFPKIELLNTMLNTIGYKIVENE